MKNEHKSFRFYREREDKSIQELAIVTVDAPGLKVAIPSQYMDLRSSDGEVFATITFPSWVKVSKIGA